jgi:hypothetical protein
VITFWPLYVTWPQYGRWALFRNLLGSHVVWSLAFAGCLLFAPYALPLLPSTNWREPWNLPEVALGTSWYFLPKSIDILFQQLLIVALVLWRRNSTGCARFPYATRSPSGQPRPVSIRRRAGGLCDPVYDLGCRVRVLVPFLILRAPNGLAYSYIMH